VSLTPALFTSAASDSADATKLRPSNWNRVVSLLNTLLDTSAATGGLMQRDSSAANGASWIEPVAAGQVLASGPTGWSASPKVTAIGIGDVPYTSAATRIHNTSGPGLVIQLGTLSNTRAPLVFTQTDGVGVNTYFNSSSALVTCTGIVLAGNQSAGPNFCGTVDPVTGAFTVAGVPGTAITSMIDVYSDVATGIVVRAFGTGGGVTYLGLDKDGNYTHAIKETGQYQWGAGANLAAMDVALARNASGALEINSTTLGTFRDLLLRKLTLSGNAIFANSTAIQFKDSGGTARTVLEFDNGNILRIINNASGSPVTVLAPSSGGQIRIQPNALNANSLTFFDSTQDFSIGTNVDVNYRLHVGRSGSSGTMLVCDTTASTGVTGCRVREGAAQSTTEVFGVYANDDTTPRFVIKGAKAGIGIVTPTSPLHVVGLTNYADNAAAVAGGLTTGAFYHTSGTLKVVT